MQRDERAEVAALIRSFFEAGKNKEITTLLDYHGPANLFTKFGENPPYTRQNSEEAFVHEQAEFANISDYEYKIDDLRVDFVGGGDVAIATFYLTIRGMFVNDYSFEGMTVGSHSRVTMVMVHGSKGWKIVHEHLSQFPDMSRAERGTAR